MLRFDSDYMEGAHPKILERLMEINFEHNSGYGCDDKTEQARNRIREVCKAPNAEVFFLAGGTQTNACVISTLLKSYEGVIACETAHVATHESGAIEYTGHKVLTIPEMKANTSTLGYKGKLAAEDVKAYMDTFRQDANWEHEVEPKMVYISQPTEYGTLYSKAELEELRSVCDDYDLKLYADGARLGYGLAAGNGLVITLADMYENCDVFYIGGTKVGALFGEAVVMKPGTIPRFFTMIKQRGALLAKGWIPAVEFDVLLGASENGTLYEEIGGHAVQLAMKLLTGMMEKGYQPYLTSPTNQQFFLMEDEKLKDLDGKVGYSFWEKADENHTVIRLATSWATREEDVEKLLEYF